MAHITASSSSRRVASVTLRSEFHTWAHIEGREPVAFSDNPNRTLQHIAKPFCIVTKDPKTDTESKRLKPQDHQTRKQKCLLKIRAQEDRDLLHCMIAVSLPPYISVTFRYIEENIVKRMFAVLVVVVLMLGVACC